MSVYTRVVKYLATARKFNQKQRDKLSAEHKAMPDGSFPIVTLKDLKNAVQSIGRARNQEEVRKHIIKRARQMGKLGAIPEQWIK